MWKRIVCRPPGTLWVKRHPHRSAFPIEAVGMLIVTGWAGVRAWLTDMAAGFQQHQRALDRFGCLNSRLHMQIADQIGIVGLERVIQRAVQLDSVLLALLPAIRTHGVEHCRKLAAGFRECGSLSW